MIQFELGEFKFAYNSLTGDFTIVKNYLNQGTVFLKAFEEIEQGYLPFGAELEIFCKKRYPYMQFRILINTMVEYVSEDIKN